jgi:CubicO group peptidase (beta-lactamase class C family)
MVANGALSPGCAQAQTSPAMPTQAQLLKIVTASRDKHGVPALGAAIVVNGQIRVGVAGVRKEGSPTSATAKDKFHLGSCTKSMTATLAALLIESGRLKWSTTLAQVFPELAATMQPTYRRVTILQLLQHRGGFAEETFPDKFPITYWMASTLPLPQQRLKYVQHVLREAPATSPGGRMLYSNRGYIVAAAMLERLTKRSWEDLMRQQVFRPLGMTSAGFGPTSTNSKRVEQPWPHTRWLGRWVACFARRETGQSAPGGTSRNGSLLVRGLGALCSLSFASGAWGRTPSIAQNLQNPAQRTAGQ